VSWDWEIVGLTEDGDARGVVLSRAEVEPVDAPRRPGITPGLAIELLWVQVDAQPRASGYQVVISGRQHAVCGSLDEAARYAARLIRTKLERWR